MVNYDQEDGVTVLSNKGTSSILTIRNATARHGGNYTCAPSNARPSSIYVHVLKGNYLISIHYNLSRDRTNSNLGESQVAHPATH